MTGQMASMLFMFDVVDRAVKAAEKERTKRETRTDFADIEVQRQEIYRATGIDPLHDLSALDGATKEN